MENIKLCEVCGKEHDGSYGSGRFCSYNCKQKYASVKGATKGGQIAKQRFGKKCKCEFCNIEFDTRLALRKHLPNCEKRIKYNSLSNNNWECPYCGVSFRTRRLLQEHNKQKHFGEGHKNQFIKAKLLGQDTPEVSEETKRKIGEKSKGRFHTEEQKKKISEARKKYLNEHPDKVPFKLNHSSKESYPEKYFREWLQKENIFVEREFQVGLYTLDFAWPEKKIYLEVDGSQHHLSWMIKHDEERTKKLSELGWVCIQRVYWPDYQKLKLEEKQGYLENLKNKIIK
jgi:very-short-patch-repair endonuclease